MLEGSFSALPKQIFAAKHSLCSSFLRSTKPSTGIVNFWQMFLNVNNFGSCLQMVAELRPKSTRAFLKDCPMLSYRAGFFLDSAKEIRIFWKSTRRERFRFFKESRFCKCKVEGFWPVDLSNRTTLFQESTNRSARLYSMRYIHWVYILSKLIFSAEYWKTLR